MTRANSGKRELYCPECMGQVIIDMGVRQARCQNSGCPTPYQLEVIGDRASAKEFHDSVASWMPKFYFQVPDSEEWAVSYHDDAVTFAQPDRLTDLIEDPTTLTLFEAAVSDELGDALTISQTRRGVTCPRTRHDFRRIDPPVLNAGCDEDERKHGMRNWSGFCRRIRGHPNSDLPGDRRCLDQDCKVACEILSDSAAAPQVYQCWAGLIDFAVAVKIPGRTLAVCLSGQRRPGPKLKRLMGDDVRPLADAFAEVAKVTGHKLNDLLELAEGPNTQSVDSEEQAFDLLKRLGEGLVSRLEFIAQSNYQDRRQTAETYFLREVAGRFPLPGHGGALAALQSPAEMALRRLVDFSTMGECLLLMPHVRLPRAHTLFVSWPRRDAKQASPEPLMLGLDDRYRERVVVRRNNSQALTNELRSKLGVSWQDPAWFGTVPLRGGSYAVVVFAPPFARSDGAGEDLGPQDQRFLRQFAITLRAELWPAMAIGRHLTRVGHALQIPTQAISARAALLGRPDTRPKDLKSFPVFILHYAKHLHYIAGSLRWGTSTYRQQREKPVIRNIGVLLKTVCDLFDAEARHLGCSIVKPVPRGSQRFPAIEMWPDELEIAFCNLIDNAVKYSYHSRPSPDRYGIRVLGKHFQTGSPAEKWYRVVIENTGIGVAPEELKADGIYQDGVRGMWAGDRNRHGSGMGLGVAKEIVELRHGGRLTLSSGPVRGSGFSWPTAAQIEAAMRQAWFSDGDLDPYTTTVQVDLPLRQTSLDGRA